MKSRGTTRGLITVAAGLGLLAASSAPGQTPPLLKEAFTREYSVFVGGDQTPLVKDVSSREVSVFIGDEASPPFAQAVAREVSVLVTTPGIPQRVTNLTVSVSPTGDKAFLSWCGYNEVAQNDVVRYRIYVSTSPFTSISNQTPFA